jgi:protein-S-isoprenylcysteine O-methyltransferase Ste14
MEVVFPFIVAGIPVLISFAPYNLPSRIPYDAEHHLYWYLGVTGLIFTGGAINLIGLFTLRRAFTVMSEARLLVTSGIYKYLRHPLYTGHFIMFFGSLCMRLHVVTVCMYALFVLGQVLRARIEERKLAGSFPGYTDYKARTGMFLPKITSN